MSFLDIAGLSKSYGEGATRTEVLGGIDLSVAEGEFLAIVGFSGSGKTTLISAIAGLITPDSGTIKIRGSDIAGPGPDRGIVFQSYSLMPWLSVYGNVALAVNAVHKRKSATERDAVTHKYIDMVG
ncbi:MAG: ATP-binding cassette domain-containing protein, partial [Pseudomonadota bacterium]